MNEPGMSNRMYFCWGMVINNFWYICAVVIGLVIFLM